MFKFLLISLLLYIAFKLIRGFFTGMFVIRQIKKQNVENGQNPQSPFQYRTGGREKDISDRARILEDDKNAE